MSSSMVQSDNLTPKDHQRVAEFIDAAVGIQLPSHKRSLIESRLRKRQKVNNMATLSKYIDYALADNSPETIMLIDALTTNKTYFFRESSHFDYIESFLSHNAEFKNKTLRVWSAGCSTGEEAFSLAMILESLRRDRHISDFRIDATDISVSVLQTARSGVYTEARIESIPESMRKLYLLKSRNSEKKLYKMCKELRQKVFFDEFNLITDTYPKSGSYDLIFCRNVMIYFNNEQRNNMIRHFNNSLTDEGVFFIGHSEGLTGNNDIFKQIIPTVYRKVSNASHRHSVDT
ncbi:CheR family methyltransferase [Marinomonas sp. IMCC 4694]|uniref:CheR family methyltransferase n=1 Tax=Marinomonas sp. IMCC 4694 TaxID=2605432 RepID=UPI0011E7A97E|nr:CheR family methyltransferase [Marinomonas sp. IMCC 4694]TYL47563.1 chemotaxis protein [Marinomonas sp. IMCC 4694]